MRVIFMGTPHFAVPALDALAAGAAPGHVWARGLDLVGVFTRPDKPAGRGRALAVSPVKEYALVRGMPVYQPGPLRAPEALALLHRLAPDLIVVAAFGQLLPPAVLELPRHCCINLHASLLPRHRGASPIAAAILAGDAETGITLMQMEEGLDTGPIIAARALPIGPDETAGELTERLAQLGARLLVETLPQWLAGSIAPTPQDATLATTTHLLRKAEARVDWSLPAAEVARRVRAFTPAPGAFTTWQGRQLKLLRVREIGAGRPPDAPTETPNLPDAPTETPNLPDAPTDASNTPDAAMQTPHTPNAPTGAPSTPGTPNAAPGTVFLASGAAPGGPVLACACGQGAIALEMIQLEGKRALPAADFLRGHGGIVGARLGEPPATS